MECLLNLLPEPYRAAMERIPPERAEELRLRAGMRPTVLQDGREHALFLPDGDGLVTRADLEGVVLAVSRQSVYAIQDQLARGYIAAPGGHRIGVCGTVVRQADGAAAMRDISSLCIRIAKDIPIPSAQLLPALSDSCLIVGAPGWGKTTLLRGCIRALSQAHERVCVVDERQEIAGSVTGQAQFRLGMHTDVLCGCRKDVGIFQLLRSMNPTWIAVDEITAPEDLDALCAASNSGVRLLATVHAHARAELERKPLFSRLLSLGVFSNYLILDRQKRFHAERSGE